jgi:hypothetical protein
MTSVTLLSETSVDVILTYRGPLPTCSRTDSRAVEKATLRQHFSIQLERHWQQNKSLSDKLDSLMEPATIEKGRFLKPVSLISNFYRIYLELGSCRFIPLIARLQRELCDLEIRWLRNEAPGAIYCSGDIDGRLKTLFDALRIPHDEKEAILSRQNKASCFCLLEDDSMIRNLTIATGRLLEPMENSSDIQVNIRATIVSEDE